MSRKRTEAQRNSDLRYRTSERGILNKREKQRRYRERIKQDPERLEKYRAYHRNYSKQWEANYVRIWLWSLKHWDWRRARAPKPLPRIEEVVLPVGI